MWRPLGVRLTPIETATASRRPAAMNRVARVRRSKRFDTVRGETGVRWPADVRLDQVESIRPARGGNRFSRPSRGEADRRSRSLPVSGSQAARATPTHRPAGLIRGK